MLCVAQWASDRVVGAALTQVPLMGAPSKNIEWFFRRQYQLPKAVQGHAFGSTSPLEIIWKIPRTRTTRFVGPRKRERDISMSQQRCTVRATHAETSTKSGQNQKTSGINELPLICQLPVLHVYIR